MSDEAWLVRGVPSAGGRWLLGAALYALGFVPTALVARWLFFEPFQIPNGGMLPTVLVGDHVVVAKYQFGIQLPLFGSVVQWDTPDRGDIVVFRYPNDRSLSYVKRVVGLPGDQIEIRDNRVVLDSMESAWTPLGEYTRLDDTCESSPQRRHREDIPSGDGKASYEVAVRLTPLSRLRNFGPIVVPPGHVFVLGDSRDDSEDSRRWGFVPMSDVIGPVQSVWFSFDDCEGIQRTDRFFRSLYGPAHE